MLSGIGSLLDLNFRMRKVLVLGSEEVTPYSNLQGALPMILGP